MKTETYPEHILEVLRKRRGLEPDDTSLDADIARTKPRQALRQVVAWHLGDPTWADMFLKWAKECGVTLE